MKRTVLFCLLIYSSLTQTLHAQSSQDLDVEFGLNVTSTLAGFFNSGGAIPIDPYLLSVKIGRKNTFFRAGMVFSVNNSLPADFNTPLLTKEQAYNIRLGFERRILVSKRFRAHWGIDGIAQYDISSTENQFSNDLISLTRWEVGVGGGPVLGIAYIINKRMYISTEAAIYAIYKNGEAELIDISGRILQPSESFQINPMIPNSLYFNFVF